MTALMGIINQAISRNRRIKGFFIIFPVYVLLCMGNAFLPFSVYGTSPIWPAASIGLVMAYFCGFSVLPGIFLGCTLAHLIVYMTGHGVLLAFAELPYVLILALGHSLEVFTGVMLCRQWLRSLSFSLDSVLKFTAITMMMSLVASVFSLGFYCLIIEGQEISCLRLFLFQLLGHFNGLLFFVPLIVIFLVPGFSLKSEKRRFEEIMAFGTLGLASLLAFTDVVSLDSAHLPHYVVIPVVIWITFRMGLFKGLLANLAVAFFAFYSAYSELWSISSSLSTLELVRPQGFIAINLLVSLFLGASREGEQRVRENLSKRLAELERIHALSSDLHRSLDIREVCRIALDSLENYTGTPRLSLYILGEEMKNLVLMGQRGLTGEFLSMAKKLPLKGSISGLAVQRRDVVFMPDIQKEEEISEKVRTELSRQEIREVVSIPLVFSEKVLGVLNLFFRGSPDIDVPQLQNLQAIGKSIGLALSNAMDVEKLSRETEQRLKAQKEVLEKQAWIESIFKAAPVGIGVVKDRILMDTNQHLCRMTGYSSRELLGKSSRILYPDEEEFLRVGKEKYTQIEKKGTGTVETKFLRKDGMILDILLSSSPIDPEEPSGGVTFTALDITYMKDTENKLRELADSLEEKVRRRTSQLEILNEELKAFAYSVSHDLRAPLRGIQGFSRALSEDYGHLLTEEGKNYLERIIRGSDRMSELISDMLVLSRVTNREMILSKVDIGSVAERIMESIVSNDPQREYEFHLSSCPSVLADPGLVKVMLENLLSNAWKFSSYRNKSVIRFGWDPSLKAFFVRDNGEGFDPKQAERLFAPFQRLHKRSRFEGTGIGLATVQRIINRHGGNIWAETIEGEGAVFYFALGTGEGI